MMQIQIGDGDGFCVVRATGPVRLDHLLDTVTRADNYCAAGGHARVLFDWSGVRGLLPFTDQLRLGWHMAQRLGRLQRIACVLPAAAITRNGERAAQRRGLNVRVFDSAHDAQAWLEASVRLH